VIFKTGGQQAILSPVGSTPTHFRQFMVIKTGELPIIAMPHGTPRSQLSLTELGRPAPTAIMMTGAVTFFSSFRSLT